MKTLADFKRELTLGSKWHRYHKDSYLGIGIVKKVQSNSVCFQRENGEDSWLTFPKASEFEINEQGEAEIYWPRCEIYEKPRQLVLRYKKI